MNTIYRQPVKVNNQVRDILLQRSNPKKQRPTYASVVSNSMMMREKKRGADIISIDDRVKQEIKVQQDKRKQNEKEIEEMKEETPETIEKRQKKMLENLPTILKLDKKKTDEVMEDVSSNDLPPTKTEKSIPDRNKFIHLLNF